MNLKDFFELNSISLELSDLFDELKEEKSKASALKSALKETLECYEGEEGERIIVQMSAYWLALTNGIKSDVYRKTVEGISADKIREAWEDDADTVIEALDALLKWIPIVPKKKKATSAGKLGSKNWKSGDLYAYRLKSKDAKNAGIDGCYAIIYCVDVKKASVKKNDVTAYLLLCFDKELPEEPQMVIERSVFLLFGIERCYLHLLDSPHSEYPDDEIKYIGNLSEIPHPENEVIPPNELYYPMLLWSNFEYRVVSRFEAWKKYGEGQEKFLK